MGYTTLPISAAQQQTILNNANIAVAKFAKSYADKLGLNCFFTKEDIEDIIGNTLYKACRSFGCYNPAKAKLSTWVSRIAVNCVISAVDCKMKHLPISYPIYAENSETGDEFGVDEYCDERRGFNSDVMDMLSEYEADRQLNEKEFRACVRAQSAKLSEKNQRFESWMEEGKTPKEMAAQEGCSADAASKRIWLIRQTLKEPLSEIADEFGFSCGKLAS